MCYLLMCDGVVSEECVIGRLITHIHFPLFVIPVVWREIIFDDYFLSVWSYCCEDLWGEVTERFNEYCGVVVCIWCVMVSVRE